MDIVPWTTLRTSGTGRMMCLGPTEIMVNRDSVHLLDSHFRFTAWVYKGDTEGEDWIPALLFHACLSLSAPTVKAA
jgi:hypothetical protein